jgi:hypothetical protein
MLAVIGHHWQSIDRKFLSCLRRKQRLERSIIPGSQQKNASMKPKVLRAIIEIGFIIFLFYSNLFMGEFERSNGARKTLLLALEDIFTFTNFLIALLSSCIGYVVFEYLRRKF